MYKPASSVTQIGIGRRRALLLLAAPAALAVLSGGGSHVQAAADPIRRIVTVGADLTEIVAELDGMERLVGCDRSSRRPAAVRERATIGVFRAISAEGVISLKPDILISTTQIGPDGVADQIAAAGIKVVFVDDEPTIAGICRKIEKVAALIGRDERARAMIATIDRAAGDLGRRVATSSRRPNLLFVIAADAGSAMAAGDIAPITAALALAGAGNAGKGWKNIKPISREAFITAPPDGMLATPDVLAKTGGAEGFLKLTGFDAVLAPPAVLAIDAGPFMLFGPSTPVIARDVARHYLPELFRGEPG
jgi:iron complex transport system substrate-binding protein